MSRAPRIEVPGGYYHVVSRGNDKQVIFDDPLRRLFLEQLGRIASAFAWEVHAWALMDTHFHLVFQITDRGLSDGMRELNTGFARASNARFGRQNHCLGERFWSRHLETDRHLYASIRYTLWNPARAGVGTDPGDSGWTSYRATTGLDWPPGSLAPARLLEGFGPSPERARRAFRRFVAGGRERCLQPWLDGAGILR